MYTKRRREIVRDWLYLILGFIQTTGAVTTVILYFGLGFHWVTWTSFGITTVAFIASRILHRSEQSRRSMR